MKTWKRILKYDLKTYDSPGIYTLQINGVSAQPLSVAEQDGKLMLWAMVEEWISDEVADIHCELSVVVWATGHPIFDVTFEGVDFIGTVVMSTGFVWHVCAGNCTESVSNEADIE